MNNHAITSSETTWIHNPTLFKTKNNGQPLRLPSVLPSQQSRTNKLLYQLPADLQAQLHSSMQKVFFKRGQTVYDIGDPIDFVYFPNDCVAARLALMEDGSMVEVGVIGKDGMLGIDAMLGATKASELTVVEISGSGVRIRTDVLKNLFRRRDDLQKLLLDYYRDLLAQVSQRSACRCRHTVAEQFCTWLLLIRERTNGNELPLTQETIARRLGARRASITVVASELVKAKAICCERGRITIINRSELESRACECYDILRAENF